jgi:energy-coupling factor transporter ATP-binding protein EcfA2
VSWFKKLFDGLTPPPTPEQIRVQALQQKAEAFFVPLKTKLLARLDEEAALLTALGLPLPEISGAVTYTIDNSEYTVQLVLPRVGPIPPHLLYWARTRLTKIDRGHNDNGYVVYTVLGTADVIAAAEQTLRQDGVIGLIRQYDGQWLNRDPYRVYKRLLQYQRPISTTGHIWSENGARGFVKQVTAQTDSCIVKDTSEPKAAPLVRERGYTEDELRELERHFAFCCALEPNDAKDCFTDELGFFQLTNRSGVTLTRPGRFSGSYFPNEVLFDLRLPEPAFGASFLTLKVLSDGGTRPAIAREFLDSIRTVSHPVSFELIDDSTTTYFQLTCASNDRALIERQLELHFPTAVVLERPAVLPTAALHKLVAKPATLSAEVRSLSEFPLDPFAQLFSLLAKHSAQVTTVLQVCCFPLPHETLAAGISVLRYTENIKAAERKFPAWQVTVSVYSSDREALHHLRHTFFPQFAPARNEWVFAEELAPAAARSMQEWTLLSTAELASFFHLPTMQFDYDRLETASQRMKLPPAAFTAGEVEIGTSRARGQQKPVALPDSVRARHVYIVGKSGSGKSTLITNIALQDIERGEGVCVIDPHGDLVSDLLDRIPARRVLDTIYFNVSDRAHPIGVDMMRARSEAEIEILTDDLITTFRRLTETWGERMETILRYAFNTLLRTPGATFLDLQKLLTNEGWRATVVRKLNFAPLADFWFNQYANMPKDAAQPILSRMTKIVLSPTLNAIFGQSSSQLNFNDVIRHRKILLVNLGGDSRDRDNEQLAVSDEMKKLIGSVVVSQLQLAAMRQASLPEAARVPCRFFVDEFQNFVSGAFPKILSEARKYKLCLTVAHQYISQLDDATRNAVFGNVGTMIVMPLGQKDAVYLGAELGSYTPEDVANLSPERHEALCRPSTQAADTFLFTTLPPKPVAHSYAHAIIEHTRATYSAEREAALPAPDPVDASETSGTKIPMREMPKDFASTAEKVLHYVAQAGYLTTQQIIELCYGHLSEASKRPAASRDLRKLTQARKLKATTWGEGKVFYVGSQCNPTAHNVAVRDILVRIFLSSYEIAEVNLAPTLGALAPDLLVSFVCEDGSLLPTYWEYDAGTEGLTEILKKVARYVPYSATSRVCFVCNTRERMQAIMKAATADFVEYCVLDKLARLDAPAFVSRARTDRYSFF